MIDPDELRGYFGSAGEPEVRRQIAQGVLGPETLGLAERWLAEQERAAEERRQKVQESQTRLTRLAATAAMVAAAASIGTLIYVRETFDQLQHLR